MAKKMCFIYDKNKIYKEEIVDYEFFKGFSPIQRKKNVISLHNSLREKYPNKNILEISTKSNCELGIKLSAFNLKLNGNYIESIFQSSKVFENNECFDFLIDFSPLDAKRFIKEQCKDRKIKYFKYLGTKYPINPQTAFYDYIYCKALLENKEFHKDLINYEIITDIEFNHKTSINCQARACLIFIYLLKNDKLYFLDNFDKFIELYDVVNKSEQMSLF